MAKVLSNSLRQPAAVVFVPAAWAAQTCKTALSWWELWNPIATAWLVGALTFVSDPHVWPRQYSRLLSEWWLHEFAVTRDKQLDE